MLRQLVSRREKRGNIVYKRVYGEQKDADFSTAGSGTENERPKILVESPTTNVYNADETGLYYRASPENTYLFGSEHTKQQSIASQFCVVWACLVEKKTHGVIGKKTENLQRFSGVTQLPLEYYSNSNT